MAPSPVGNNRSPLQGGTIVTVVSRTGGAAAAAAATAGGGKMMKKKKEEGGVGKVVGRALMVAAVGVGGVYVGVVVGSRVGLLSVM